MRDFPGIDVSYAVSRDADLINWRAFLGNKYHTDLEWLAARDLSVRWQTTAVADVSVYLPRYTGTMAKGTPKSLELQSLNKKFSQAIWNKDVEQAKHLYNHIVKRGLELTMQFLKDETIRDAFAAAS